MSQGAFDPAAFTNLVITESNDTKVIPVPAGEYVAVATKAEPRPWQSRKDPSNAGLALDILWEIDDPGVASITGRDKSSVKQGIMLDLTDNGGLDMGRGKNVGLGRLREALGLNVPGQPFSFGMIPGRVARVVVSHRASDDGQDVYPEIRQVAKLG